MIRLNSGKIYSDQTLSFSIEKNTTSRETDAAFFDMFLNSISDVFADRALLVLCSGAETGNLTGLRKIKKNNGLIIAQKSDSCLVPYPIEEVLKEGLVNLEVSQNDIAKEILRYSKKIRDKGS